MRLSTLVLISLAFAPMTLAAAEPAVKKSEQGICHERGSATYKRTKHYDSFDTMDACLASGGRLAKNAPLEGSDGEKPGDSGSSWLGKIGGKIVVIIGMLVIVGGAFLLSRRRSP